MRNRLEYGVVVLCALVAIAGIAGYTNVSDRTLTIDVDTSAHALISIINTSQNVITDKYRTLDPVIKRLAECRGGAERVVSILHIGDSHVQAGFLSNDLRSYFQTNFGDAGRGMITPLKLIGTNEPSDYDIYSANEWHAMKCIDKGLTEKVGFTGINICTQQPNIDFKIISKSEFCVVRAFHHPSAPQLVEPEDLSIGSYCDQNDTSVSTTIALNKSVNEITLRAVAEGDYNVGQFYGFSLENGKPGVLFHSVGINGASIDHYNRNSYLAEQSALLEPDLIIISLGTNDAFGNNFDRNAVYQSAETLIKNLKKCNPNAAILITTPLQCCKKTYSKGRAQYVHNDNITAVAAEIVKAAENNKVAYWDAYSACGAENTCENWSKNGFFQKDMVHLTKEGYAFKSKLFGEAFSNYYNQAI